MSPRNTSSNGRGQKRTSGALSGALSGGGGLGAAGQDAARRSVRLRGSGGRGVLGIDEDGHSGDGQMGAGMEMSQQVRRRVGRLSGPRCTVGVVVVKYALMRSLGLGWSESGVKWTAVRGCNQTPRCCGFCSNREASVGRVTPLMGVSCIVWLRRIQLPAFLYMWRSHFQQPPARICMP